jgi:hypothetical protein
VYERDPSVQAVGLPLCSRTSVLPPCLSVTASVFVPFVGVQVVLHVLTSNVTALNLYYSMGFVIVREIPGVCLRSAWVILRALVARGAWHRLLLH